jgi:hypothetical protein
VLTTEWVNGVTIDKVGDSCSNSSYEWRFLHASLVAICQVQLHACYCTQRRVLSSSALASYCLYSDQNILPLYLMKTDQNPLHKGQQKNSMAFCGSQGGTP